MPTETAVTQSELKAVCVLFDLAHELALAIRARLEAGAPLQRGVYVANVEQGCGSVRTELRYIREPGPTSLCGLRIASRKKVA